MNEKPGPIMTSTVKETKEKFTELNRLVAEEGITLIVTKRGRPNTVIMPITLLRKLLGDEKTKEILFESFLKQELESRVEDILNEKEKFVSFDELKKKLGW